MNWKRVHTGCRIFVQLVLVTSLLTVTFVQFLKLKKETTNVGISYNDGKQDLEFPSITFCPVIWKNRPENVTFEDYMKHALNFSNFFESAWQNTYMPGGRYAHNYIMVNALRLHDLLISKFIETFPKWIYWKIIHCGEILIMYYYLVQ